MSVKISLPEILSKARQKPLLPLTVAVVIVYLVFAFLSLSAGDSVQLPPAVIQPTSRVEHVVAFAPQTNSWQTGRTHDLDVVFNAVPQSAATTIGFSIQYDSAVFEVVGIAAGDLWTKSTFLEKNIQQGVARVTLAQALDGALSEKDNPHIVTVSFRVKPDVEVDSTVISFGQEGSFGSVDLDHLEAVVGIPARITLQR